MNEEYRMKKAKSQCIFHVILISRSIFYTFLCFWGYYTAVVSCRITYIDVFFPPLDAGTLSVKGARSWKTGSEMQALLFYQGEN